MNETVVSLFSVSPEDEKSFDCRPFEELFDKDILRIFLFDCNGIKQTGRGIPSSVPRALVVILVALLSTVST